jgi:hypothetical protein
MPTEKYGHCFLGVDYATPPHELSRSALADASNVVPDDSGLPTGRGGSVKLNSTSLSSEVWSVHEFRSGSTKYTLASYSTKIGYYNSGTGEFVDSNTGLTDNKMRQWVNFAGKAISVNEGSDAPQYWAATDTYGDLAGSPTNGLTIAEWSNRVWLGGNSTDVALLTACHLNDPTNWGAGTETQGVSQTVGDSKDPITGLFGFFDMLLVGKKNNIYKVTGAPATDATSLEIVPLYSKSTDNTGFTSPWAITQVGNDVIFLDGFDIKRLSGIQEYGDVEYTSIIPHLGGYLKTIADRDYLQYTQFFHYKKQQQIWVSIPTGAATRYVFVLDYKFKNETGRYAFYPMGNLIINCFGGVEDGEVVNMYYGDRTGYVRQLDVGNNDDGAAISRYFITMISGNDVKNDIITRHENRKTFLNTDAYINSEQAALSMTPYYALDLLDAAQVRTSGNYTSLGAETVTGWNGTGIYRKRIPLRGISGYTLALKWLHSTVAQNFTFYPSMVTFNYKSKNRIT